MTATDWRTHATQANQQRFGDAQARLDFDDYPPGEAGRRQRAEDERFADWYDQAVNAASQEEFERQCEDDELNARWPEPADGARIEWEGDDGTLFAAYRQDLPEHAGGSWFLYGSDDRHTWGRLVAEYRLPQWLDDVALLTEETEMPCPSGTGDVPSVPSHLLDQADILAKVGMVSREALYGLVATTWETALGVEVPR